jgi:hypothetical protein
MLTLSNFGCVIPPQGGMVYSRTGQAARKCGEEWAVDVWSLEDISAICHKLISYAAQKKPADLSSWLVERDRGELNRMWIEAVGDDR